MTAVVHQALHGYAEGHHLLKSSLRLGPEAERTLLVLSDISGPAVSGKFESYLTGYPVTPSLYALARTWAATEMRRPGCVWTHTLLIARRDMERLHVPDVLRTLFKRPNGKEQIADDYRNPVEVPLVARGPSRGSMQSRLIAARLLAALYEAPTQSVVFVTSRLSDYEDLIFGIWAQQWTSLRMGFSFCTTALSPRAVGRRQFDLQLAPPSAGSRHRAAGVLMLTEESLTPDFRSLGWTDEAARELSGEGSQPLTAFLHEFGDDAGGGRAAFAALARVHLLLTTEADLNAVISLLARCFPGADRAEGLKRALLAPKDRVLRERTDLDEVTLLETLVSSPDQAAFDAGRLNISERSGRVWSSRREAAFGLLARAASAVQAGGPTPVAAACLSGIAASLSPDDLVELAGSDSAYLELIVKTRPSLLVHSEVWRGSSSVQERLWRAARAVSIEAGTIPAIVESILRAGADSIAEDVVERFAPQSVDAVLDWLNCDAREVRESVSAGWRRALELRRDQLVMWLQHQPCPRAQVVALVVQLLVQPFGPPLSEGDAETVMTIALKAKESYLAAARCELMALVLTLGLQNRGRSPDILASMAFEVVHDAAEQDELSHDAWSVIEPHVPFLWSRNWDKCERLREAMLEAHIRNHWPLGSLASAVTRETTFRRLITFAAETRAGRKLCREMRRQRIGAPMHQGILEELGWVYERWIEL